MTSLDAGLMTIVWKLVSNDFFLVFMHNTNLRPFIQILSVLIVYIHQDQQSRFMGPFLSLYSGTEFQKRVVRKIVHFPA